MTLHKALHPSDILDRKYVSRKEGRGLIGIEEDVYVSIQRPEDYTENHERRLSTVTGNNTDNTSINRTKQSENKNGKKNNFKDTSSDKQAKYYTRNTGHG